MLKPIDVLFMLLAIHYVRRTKSHKKLDSFFYAYVVNCRLWPLLHPIWFRFDCSVVKKGAILYLCFLLSNFLRFLGQNMCKKMNLIFYAILCDVF